MTEPAPRFLSPAGWWLNFLAIALFWAVYVAVQTPLPAINEPHYLCKAKHFWQPDYCPGDFFLDSSNTHFVFYVTFGWLTTFLSLEAVALIGRTIGIGLLAAGWTSLIRRISTVAWAPFGAAALFLGVTSWQNFSGEWIVGGIESKVMSYGCAFFAWSFLCDRSWQRFALLIGLAISFHPVVGIWSLASTLVSGGLMWLSRTQRASLPSRRDLAVAGFLVILFAMPGLIPALLTLQAETADASVADRIQVFERLGHHLNPMQFPRKAYVTYLILFAVWAACRSILTRRRSPEAPNTDFPAGVWSGIVLGSLLIALAGLAVGWLQSRIDSDLLVKLMKFYPFRLADVLLPMAAAVSVINLVNARRWTARWLTAPVAIGCLYACYTALTLELPSRNPEKHSPAKMASWIGMCRWIDENVPADAVVVAPRSSKTFLWYASRASYVTFKDCPQDAAGILEWHRRMELIQDWASRSFESGRSFSAAELAQLGELTGASYLIASRRGPMETEPIHRNEHYRIYRLHDVVPGGQ